MKKCLAFFFAALLGISAGVLAASSFQITKISDSSMLPTYEEGEHIFVIKASGIFDFAFSRGDVVLYENPVYTVTGEGSIAVKRVIAGPKDRVAITDGRVYVNGEALDESAYLLTENTSGEMAERKIDAGGAFVLGDNRTGSTDSRSRAVGVIKKENLLGKVIYKW